MSVAKQDNVAFLRERASIERVSGKWSQPFAEKLDCCAEELATLRARAERAEAERDRIGWLVSNACGENIQAIILDNLSAQSTIADLTGQVERLREAIEKAPHICCASTTGYVTPEYFGGDGIVKRYACDCWKSKTLGGTP